MAAADSRNRTVRLLVAIASFGGKNLEFLNRIIRGYQNMSLAVDVVVFSNAPKDLGKGVKVVVGLPSRNPWSLPFAHKPYFAQNVDQYDLFVYSEDDMEVSERNLLAFLEVSPHLKPDEIAGFLRYEKNGSGDRSLPEVHGPFNWKPESVKRRGAYTVAEFSNEHAAFYLLTREQLKRAIASGGFLREPCEGRYDMLCTAATDPYTNCGFRKVVCISAIEDFLVHHVSNRYASQLGLPFASFAEQVKTLMDIGSGKHPATTLFKLQSKLLHEKWSKPSDEKPDEELLSRIAASAKTVLSIGTGWGNMEVALRQRDYQVTALPLNSVVGASVERQGIEVVYGTWEECLKNLGDRQFDCVCLKDLLHLQANPGRLVGQCAQLVKAGGTLLLAGPNFSRMSWLAKRVFGIGEFRKLRSFDQGGITVCGPGTLAGHIRNAGLQIAEVLWLNHQLGRSGSRGNRICLGRLTAKDWLLKAQRDESDV